MSREAFPEENAFHIGVPFKPNPHKVVDFTFLEIGSLPQVNYRRQRWTLAVITPGECKGLVDRTLQPWIFDRHEPGDTEGGD